MAAWLVRWLIIVLLLLRDFGSYEIIFMNVCVIITVTTVWLSFAVKGFWALCSSVITVAIVMLLRRFIMYLYHGIDFWLYIS
jgi:uncharacterized membrane protein